MKDKEKQFTFVRQISMAKWTPNFISKCSQLLFHISGEPQLKGHKTERVNWNWSGPDLDMLSTLCSRDQVQQWQDIMRAKSDSWYMSRTHTHFSSFFFDFPLKPPWNRTTVFPYLGIFSFIQGTNVSWRNHHISKWGSHSAF